MQESGGWLLFWVGLYSATEDMDILAISRAFFVQNNSKHESKQHEGQPRLPSSGSRSKFKEEPLKGVSI